MCLIVKWSKDDLIKYLVKYLLLIKSNNFYNGTYLACTLIARGNLTVNDLMNNIEKQKNKLRIVS